MKEPYNLNVLPFELEIDEDAVVRGLGLVEVVARKNSAQ